MTQARFHRWALLVPVVLPSISWLCLATGMSVQHVPDAGPIAWLVIWLYLVTIGALFYGLPYLVAAAILWRTSREWPATRLRRWVWILPTLLVAGAGLVVALANGFGALDPDWFDYVRETIRSAAAVGYGEALLIWIAERAGAQCGWLRADVGTV